MMALAEKILNGGLSEAVDWYAANAGTATSRRMVRHGRRLSEVVVSDTGRVVRHTEDVSLGTEEGAVAIGDGLQFSGLRWIVRMMDAQSDGLVRCTVECVEPVERGKGAGEWRGRLT